MKGGWHAETGLVQLTLRRYSAGEPDLQYLAREPYDAICRAEVRHGRAWVDGMLVAGPPLSREDRRQIEALLREHGAAELEADRHGKLVRRIR